jgi:hypothetical protein
VPIDAVDVEEELLWLVFDSTVELHAESDATTDGTAARTAAWAQRMIDSFTVTR